MPEQLVSFAGTSLVIEYTGERAAKVVDFLYRHIASSPKAALPHVRYQIYTNDTDSLILTRNGEFVCSQQDDAVLVERLLGDSSFDFADHVLDGLLFHAAGLNRKGQGVLLAGSSGTGKTTLSTFLVTQGFDFLSDEFVYLPDGSRQMHGLTRPLNIKRPAKELISKYFDINANKDSIFSGNISHLIPPELIRPDNQTGSVGVQLLVFPYYTPKSDFICIPLSKARAAMELMQCLLNARNLPTHGFHAIAALIERLPAYALYYSSFDQLDKEIEQLLRQH